MHEIVGLRYPTFTFVLWEIHNFHLGQNDLKVPVWLKE